MLPPIPNIADYGISPIHGFLPDALPLTRLPDPYYNKWESIATNLQNLILTRRLRGVIDQLPVLSTVGLEQEGEWRRAYVLLTFFAHGYIWGGDEPRERVPPGISVPLLRICQHLEVPPVSTYAASVLWNFKPLFKNESIESLDNLASLVSFTGSLDEAWFYLVSVAIEARGGPIIPLMLQAIQAARDGDADTVTCCLQTFAERLDDLGPLLRRMHENCDPGYFYRRIRTFLAGSKNMAEAGLPNGVIWDDGSGKSGYVQYSGPSNAQSSLIHFFDVVLGIEHRPTGEKKPPVPTADRGRKASDTPAPAPTSAPAPTPAPAPAPAPAPPSSTSATPRHNFIQDMRRYMPGPHARFLADLAAVANIREFVAARKSQDRPLALAYDACLSMLSHFRDIHINIVTRYIIVPSREKRARSRSPEVAHKMAKPSLPSDRRSRDGETQVRELNLATASNNETKTKNYKGTGGTALIPFLKQARDETGEPATQDWARNLMGRRSTAVGAGHFFAGREDGEATRGDEAVEVVEHGLAGTWKMDDDIGGICNY